MTLELELDTNCILIGEVKEVDASFDHEFGFKVVKQLDVISLNVIVFIDGMDYDMTFAREQDLNYFKEKLLEKAYSVFNEAS